MPYDEYLEERISRILENKKVPFEAKKMMGGLCYMVDDKMCVGVIKDSLMARIDPQQYEKALNQPGARQMDFTGRPMKGYILVEPEGIDQEEDLERWIDQCLEFNPKARSSKKKKA